jgi:hypothetical protein
MAQRPRDWRLTAIQPAEFRQFRQKRMACNLADTLNRLKKLILHAPHFVRLDRRRELRVDVGDFPIEHVDHGVDGALNFGQAGLMASIEFGGSEIEELPASRKHGIEFSSVFIGKIACRRLHVVRETSQDAGVDAVGFGENAQGVGIIAGLSRIDDDDRQLGLVQRDDEQNFVASGGFDDDPFDVLLLQDSQDLHDASDAVGVVGKSVEHGTGEVGQIESDRRNIDAETDVDTIVGESRIRHSD